MNRRTIILLFVLFLPLSMYGREHMKSGSTGFTFGCEWGYVATLHYGVHHNFFSEEGYRVDYRDEMFRYHTNAEIMIHVGYNLNPNWNISLNAGYCGVSDMHHAIPVSFRATRLFKCNPYGDRWFTFLDLGSGIDLKKEPQELLCGKIGGGYRLSLSRKSGLEFLFAYRMSFTHPEVSYDGYQVKLEKINRNNAYISALSMGIRLTF